MFSTLTESDETKVPTPIKVADTKIGDFALRKKGRKKTQMTKFEKSGHQVTWAQKAWPKREWIFNFKIFKYE